MNSSSLAIKTINQLKEFPRTNPVFKIIDSLIKDPTITTTLTLTMDQSSVKLNHHILNLYKKKKFTLYSMKRIKTPSTK